MAMNQAVWGPAVRAAVQALNVADNSPITSNQLDQVWIAITGEHRSHLTDNVQVFPDGITPMNNPIGQPVLVSIPSGIGATTAPEPTVGEGRIE